VQPISLGYSRQSIDFRSDMVVLPSMRDEV
jgi:hypothetical protein